MISPMHRVLLAAIFVHLGISTAESCSCAGSPQPLVALAQADAVFLGSVIEQIDPTPDVQPSASMEMFTCRLLVEYVWKGELSDTFDVQTAKAECGYRFELDKTYLVYARLRGDEYRTGLCSRTRPREAAVDDILELNTLPATGAPALVDSLVLEMMMDDLAAQSPEARKTAARALRRIGKRADMVVPHLRQAYDDGSTLDRIQVIEALGSFDNIGGESQALATAASEDEDPDLRVAALRTIYRLDGPDEWKIPALLRGMRDSHAGVRTAAIGSGIRRPPSVNPTKISHRRVQLLTDEDSGVRLAAARSLYLAARDYPSALPQLMIAARDSSHHVRTAAIKALANYDVSTPGLIPVLIKGLSDPEEWVRVVTASRLGTLGENPSADLLVPPLQEAIRDESERVRAFAAGSLGRFLPDPQAREVLMNSLRTGDESLRHDALVALTLPDRDPETALVAIQIAMSQSSSTLRGWAVGILRRFAADHAEARGLLQAALEDPDPRVRRDATHALRRLELDAIGTK